MKCIVNAGRVKKRITPLVEVATKGGNPDHPHCGFVMLDASFDEIKGVAFNGHVGTVVDVTITDDPSLNYECTEEGTATVYAADLMSSLDSFPETANLILSSSKGELIIANGTDKEELQALPLVDEEIKCPQLASKFDKEARVDKNLFLEGVNKIMFAVGNDKSRPQYSHWMMDTDTKKVRFAAGTGARFISCWFDGEKCGVESDKPYKFFFNGSYTPVIQKVVAEAQMKDDDQKLVVKQSSVNDTAPAQIVLEMRDFSVSIVGIDTDIKWPEIDAMVFDVDKTAVVKVKREDLKYPVKGIMATFNDAVKKENKVHVSSLTFDGDADHILWAAKMGMRSKRKIPVADFVQKPEKSLTLNCVSRYVSELCNRLSGDENTIVTFEAIGPLKPIVYRFPTEEDSVTGITSKVAGFFASLNDPEE